MNDYTRNIILLLKTEKPTAEHIELEVQLLHNAIEYVDNEDCFCIAHELVNRNAITSNKKTILNAIRNEQLKPFRFLLNKN